MKYISPPFFRSYLSDLPFPSFPPCGPFRRNPINVVANMNPIYIKKLAQRLEEDRMQRQKDDMLQPAWGGEGGPNQESLPSPAAAASVSERPGAGVVGDEGRNV